MTTVTEIMGTFPKTIPASITVVSDKGGVAKSTTVANLAVNMAGEEVIDSSGRKTRCRVLVVDLDPRGDAAIMLGIQPSSGVFEYFVSDKVGAQDVIKQTIHEYIDVLPGNQETAMLGWIHNGRGTTIDEIAYRMNLLTHDYQVVIFDTAAASGKLRDAAISISSIVILPAIPEQLSIIGIEAIMGKLNGKQVIILPTLVQNNRVHAGYVLKMGEWWPNQVIHLNEPQFTSRLLIVKNQADAKMALEKGVTVSQYNIRSQAACAYHELAQQVRTRLGQDYNF